MAVASTVAYFVVRGELRSEIDASLRDRRAAFVARPKGTLPARVSPRVPSPRLGGAAGYWFLLRDTSAEETVPARIAAWEDGDAVVVQRAASILQEICGDDNADLARMSVGLRVVRGLLAH